MKLSSSKLSVLQFFFQTSSSDEEAGSPAHGESISKDPPRPLESESEHGEQDSAEDNSGFDDDEKVEVAMKARNYQCPQVVWTTVTVLTHKN
jgi:hypothetical protein